MTKHQPLYIRALACLSPLGRSGDNVASRLLSDMSGCSWNEDVPVFRLSSDAEDTVHRDLENQPARIDRVTQLVLAAAGGCITRAGTDFFSQKRWGVSIGSSRGPTATIEETFTSFLAHSQRAEESGKVPAHTSPATTAGTISSWVAQRLLAAVCDHSQEVHPLACGTSMTCSSSFHSLLIGTAMIRAGMCDAWVFGGAEAPITPYTLAQMNALRIYSGFGKEWPCRPMQLSDEGTRSSFVLGEGAGVGVLTSDDSSLAPEDLELLGVGWGLERIPSPTGVTTDGSAFVAAMTAALEGQRLEEVSCVIPHAPGVKLGDEAELAALMEVFQGRIPPLVTTKHLTGHTFGAAGVVSLQLASALLRGAEWLGGQYPGRIARTLPATPSKILINTAGFGGNAISLLVSLRG